MLDTLIPIAILIVAGFGAMAAIRAYRRRVFATFADEMGFDYLPEQDLATMLSEYDIVAHGFSDRFFNCIEGASDGLKFTLFDHRCLIRIGQRVNERTQTVAWIQSERSTLPSFHMRPKRLLDFSTAGTELKINAEFDKKFVVQSTASSARGLFTSAVRQHLENLAHCTVQSGDDGMLFYFWNKTASHQQLQPLLEDALKLFLLLESAEQAPEVTTEIVEDSDGRLRLVNV